MEKINIAIADDNERMQEMLGNVIKQDDTLELIGQTGNGNDIYSIIRDKEPDVVLLDIFMPKMDGLTVMEKVNEDKNLKKRPAFIVVSAVGEERITEDAFRLGAYYYVLKPFDNETLLNRIKATKGMTSVRRYQRSKHLRNFAHRFHLVHKSQGITPFTSFRKYVVITKKEHYSVFLLQNSYFAYRFYYKIDIEESQWFARTLAYLSML